MANQISFDGESLVTDVQDVVVDSNIQIEGSDVSGGGTSGNTAQAAQRIEEFVSEGGQPLAIPYGRHLIAGNLIVHKFVLGTPNQSFIVVALGDGQGNFGGHGEWEEAEAVFYAGNPLSVSADGSTAGYRFYNGYIATAVDSGNQPVDPFLPNGLAYSGTPIIAVKLPDDYVNEDRPDKLRGIYKCRRTYDFDATGRQIGYGYSVNPARVAADRILAYYEHRFPNDAARAMRALQDKVDWGSWYEWKLFNAEEISWDDGGGAANIPRFECHVVFTSDAILADALDQICASCGAIWQDDGERLVFFPPSEREPVHHFTEANILRAPRIEPRDLRDRPNYFIVEYRDLDDDFLGLTSVEIRRESLINQVGELKATRALPNMTQSQAQRLGERMARLESDNPNIITLTGAADSMRALPGDFVTISHTLIERPYQRCLVLSAAITSAESEPGACEFVLQQIDDALYSDTAHGPRQGAETP